MKTRNLNNIYYSNKFEYILANKEKALLSQMIQSLKSLNISVEAFDLKEAYVGYNLSSDSLIICCDNEEQVYAREHNIAFVSYDTGATSDASFVILSFEGIDYAYLNRIFYRHLGQPWAILTTDRCLVRELSLSDIDDLYELYECDSIKKYIEPLFQNHEEEISFQSSYIDTMYGFYELGLWLVYERKSGKLIGRAGIELREIDNKVEIELGYMIADSYQRQGIAYEVCSAIIDYIWTTTEYESIHCLMEKDNVPSIGLARKLGFEYQREIIQAYKGHKTPLFLYRICK